MDEFDEAIKRAQQTVTPSDTFVPETMTKIKRQPAHKGWTMKLGALIVGGAAALAAILFIALPIGFNLAHRQAPAAPANQAPAATQPMADDDASLTDDLSNVDSTFNQEDTDQKNTDAALNDNSQQISVPTYD